MPRTRALYYIVISVISVISCRELVRVQCRLIYVSTYVSTYMIQWRIGAVAMSSRVAIVTYQHAIEFTRLSAELAADHHLIVYVTICHRVIL